MTFPSYVVRALPKLSKVVNLTASRRHLLWSVLRIDSDILNTLVNFAVNALYNPDLNLSDAVKSKLRRHKKHLVKLTDKKLSARRKARYIKRHGHKFIHPLLTSVLLTVKRHVRASRKANEAGASKKLVGVSARQDGQHG